MDPKLPPVIKMVGEEFDKVKPGVAIRSAHVGMAASNTYVFLTEVLPRAIKKYGGVDPDALRKAALEVDIPEGGTMLGFGVKFDGEGTPDGRPERALVPGGHPVHRRQVLRGVAEEPGAARGRAAAAEGNDVQQPVAAEQRRSGAGRSDGLVKRFGGFTAVNNVSFKVEQGEILGLIGPNGSGKSTIFNMLSGTLAPTAGSILFDGARDRGPRAAPHHQQRHRPHLPDPAAVPPPHASSRTWRWPAIYGQGRHSRAKADEAAERALAMVGLPTDRHASVDGLGAAGLKKLELAKALATGPKLLLADESLGGLDEHEMDQAADMLRKIRDELGITIIWVEHIMGVLMRVVDRVMVLDHGEKISEGLPSAVAGDPARDRGLSRHRCRCRRQAAAAEARRRAGV